ncbi:MAG: hypothetical protein GC199_06965 [Alphaproteobacteria bacterium]|nr:hypothetical protein [Alphaproteobacteria bacterium]
MASTNAILEDAVNRLFADAVTHDLLRATEAGKPAPVLERAVAEMGLADLFAGNSDDPWRDAAIVLKACGRHALPLALAEQLMEKAPGDAMEKGALMRAAQLAGAVERTLALTVQYARDRVQFGKPIGSFQAIQQQLAILAGQSASASAAVDAAFETAARGESASRDIAVAKVRAGEAAGAAVAIAHQVHGAIGFTDEHVLHHFTRRLWMWRGEFGAESYWAARLADWALAGSPDDLWSRVATRR